MSAGFFRGAARLRAATVASARATATGASGAVATNAAQIRRLATAASSRVPSSTKYPVALTAASVVVSRNASVDAARRAAAVASPSARTVYTLARREFHSGALRQSTNPPETAPVTVKSNCRFKPVADVKKKIEERVGENLEVLSPDSMWNKFRLFFNHPELEQKRAETIQRYNGVTAEDVQEFLTALQKVNTFEKLLQLLGVTHETLRASLAPIIIDAIGVSPHDFKQLMKMYQQRFSVNFAQDPSECPKKYTLDLLLIVAMVSRERGVGALLAEAHKHLASQPQEFQSGDEYKVKSPQPR